MRKIRLWLYYTFGLSKVEANGLVIFLPLILFIIFLPSLVRELTFTKATLTEDTLKLDSLVAQFSLASATSSKPIIFSPRKFNPNTVTSDELSAMGLKPSVVSNWIKYRESGGRFYEPHAIKRIYGLNDSVAGVLLNYVILEKKPQKTKESNFKKKSPYPQKNYQKKFKPQPEPFDLNLADTTMLKKVRGIGSVLSKRIVKYRSLLGGFVKKDQLYEVYGLKDSVIMRLDSITFINSDGSGTIHRLFINSASAKTLAGHPYLSGREASLIVNYRYQHGSFQALKDLYKIRSLDSLTIDKIAPYLKF